MMRTSVCDRFILAALVALLVLHSFGCRTSKSTESIPDGQLFSPTDQAAIDRVSRAYDDLLATSDETAARAALVQQLSTGDADISEAYLFEDGTTIFLHFRDGAFGLLDTLDYAALASPASRTPQSNGVGLLRQPLEEGRLPVPDARKITFINAVATDSDKAWVSSYIASLGGRLTARGFADSDVDVRALAARSASGQAPSNGLSLRDFLSLGSSGVAIVFAHGSNGKPRTSESASGPAEWVSRHYTRCCLDDPASFAMSNDLPLEEYVKKGMIVIGGGIRKRDPERYIWVRSDLLDARLGLMGKTMVLWSVCWGWNARDAFLKNGAGSVWGWDGILGDDPSQAWLSRTFDLMLDGETAMSDQAAFTSQGFPQTSVSGISGAQASLHLSSTPPLYMPAWAHVTVPPGALPAEAVRVSVKASFPTVSGATASLELTVDGDGASGDFDQLAPIEVIFEATAFDKAGNSVDQSNTRLTLRPGANEVSLEFSPYTLARDAAGTQPIWVDDDLIVSVNGKAVFTDQDRVAGDEGLIRFGAKPGDVLKLEVWDYGTPQYMGRWEISPVYLIKGSHSVQVTPGASQDWHSYPESFAGVVWSTTFTITDFTSGS